MTERVEKFLRTLDANMRQRLRNKLLELKASPRGVTGSKKMKGYSGAIFRLRVGKIRIIYKVTGSTVEIVDIDYRGNIY